MPESKPPFEYPSALDKYMVNEEEFLKQNTQHQVLVIGACIFNSEGKLLLIQRAADEHAFPNFWEVPGGKVDNTDQSVLHAVAREVKEETGLTVSKFIREVGSLGWDEVSRRTGEPVHWHKLVFEVEVKDEVVVLDPVEHQNHLFASETDVSNDVCVRSESEDVVLTWISPPNKALNVDAFRDRAARRNGQVDAN
ncbi:hypothetical protein EJ04DRAFT_543552 [Polyplosphaeria fusca]|uniref:Nudix hydrolase domain-containing protein n=1 Tax=Polyplosphaeria fusca TaxID=682080 RepID=A0A9P4V3R8_9PLEO|nr:hypothetical protein EJ04DRAFT_543552 [Polyplosphaeria fusca]